MSEVVHPLIRVLCLIKICTRRGEFNWEQKQTEVTITLFGVLLQLNRDAQYRRGRDVNCHAVMLYVTHTPMLSLFVIIEGRTCTCHNNPKCGFQNTFLHQSVPYGTFYVLHYFL